MRKMMNRNLFVKRWRPSGKIQKLTYILKILISTMIYTFTGYDNKNRYWLIGLGDDIYANNGRVFYEYMCQYHTEIDMYWVCNKESITLLKEYIPKERLITRASINNYCMARGAEVAVYGFSDRDIAPGYYRIFRKHKTILVNVSHGFDGLKGMSKHYYKILPADIICAASAYEQEIKIKQCGADSRKVMLTGFARYDEWEIDKSDSDKSIKQIFIMPTWRDWYEESDVEWISTPLYREYVKFLKELDIFTNTNGIKVICKLHPRMQALFGNLDIENLLNINIADDDISIKELLIKSDVVITDYSSVFWDAIYMNKKILLYWFDYDEYSQKRGLLVQDDFYPYIAKNQDELFLLLGQCLQGELMMSNISKRYFEWKDRNNCDRIFNAIQKYLIN